MPVKHNIEPPAGFDPGRILIDGPNEPVKQLRRPRKRGYSREFAKQPDSMRYLLDDIPADLWMKARSRARRKGISMRALILQLLTEWNEQ
jgi:hypothetical protein